MKRRITIGAVAALIVGFILTVTATPANGDMHTDRVDRSLDWWW